MFSSFEFYCPTKIEFGVHAVEKLGSYIEELKISKPVIVTDKFISQVPEIKKIIQEIDDAVIFDKVLPNPTNTLVMDLKSFVEEHQGNGLIVFGGGSSIDSAKAASVVAYTENDVKCYYDFAPDQLQVENTLPLIVIPTTAGTGSEVSKYAVISDDITKVKECITSDLITPRVAIVDPELTIGMPPKVTVSTGLDALSHALESLTSNIENPLTNTLAFRAIELILDNLNVTRLDGKNIEARTNMSFAATIAGIAMSHCCGTIGHAMGCQLTAQYGVPHGIACAVVQKDALDYVGDKIDNIKKLVDYLDKKNYAKNDVIPAMKQKIDKLYEELGIEMNMKEYEMTSDGISQMADDAMKHGCMSLNPVEMKKKEIYHLFEKMS